MADDHHPRLESCYFGAGDRGDRYARLAQVLEYTAHKHCPGWRINVERLDPPYYTSAMGNQSHVWNTQKLEHWRRQVLEAPEGAQILLIDGDMMIVRPLDDVWTLDFDVAYTIRDATRLPLNGGVVFLRASDLTRRFMDTWWETNLRFLRDAPLHKPWRYKYAGINQASLGYLLEKIRHGCRVENLACREWNLCEWERSYDPNVTRIIHIKSGLRRAVFNMYPAPRMKPKVQQLVRAWHQTEREAQQWRSRQAETSASSATEATRSMSAGA